MYFHSVKSVINSVWTLFNELVNSPTKLLVNQLKNTATYGQDDARRCTG
jgi:hypothetical protein